MKARDLFSEWFRETFSENEEDRLQAMKERVSRETGIPADMLSGDTEDSCRAYAAQLTAYAKPYPALRDAALYGDMIPDGRSAREKFAERFGQVFAFDPFKVPGGWKRII